MHIFSLFKKTKHICFSDTNNVINMISYNITSYLFERHQNYGILITKFVIEYNWNRKNQLFWYYLCYYFNILKLFLIFKYLTSLYKFVFMLHKWIQIFHTPNISLLSHFFVWHFYGFASILLSILRTWYLLVWIILCRFQFLTC